MCLFTTEWTSIGFHCKGLFRTNKRTPYGWSWLPGLCIVISVHKICIADGLPWMPDPYRDPLDTQNGCHRRHTVRIATGHRVSVTILGDSCYSRLLGHLHRCLQREPSSVAVDYFWIVSICCHGGGYHLTIPYRTLLYHTIPYHTILHHTIPHHTIHHHTTPDHTTPYQTIPSQTRNNTIRGLISSQQMVAEA